MSAPLSSNHTVSPNPKGPGRKAKTGGSRPNVFAYLGRTLRTTAFRFTLLYISLFLLAVTLLIVFVYESTFRPAIKQIDQSIADEIVFFEKVYNERGSQALAQVIRGRSVASNSSIYLVVQAKTGVILSPGPLKKMPPEALQTTDLFRFTYTPISYTGQAGERRPGMGRVGRLRNPVSNDLEYAILAARDVYALDQLQNNARSTMIRVGIVTLLLGLILGFITSRSFLSKVDNFNKAVAAIRKGDLSRRMPVEGVNDEFDGLAENLNGMLDQIERLMIGMREVSDNIAHDLRSPLTRIRNNIHTAMTLSGEERDEALDTLSIETEKLLATFNALLSITRLESGEGAGVLKSININPIVEELTELYEPAAADAGFALSVENNEVPNIQGSRELVSQALSNLLDNALKYAVWHQGDDIPKGEIRVSLKKAAGDVVILAVADNGPGVPPQDRPKILNRFFRLDASRTTQGSGLGLSMVGAIARAHEAQLVIGSGLPRKVPRNIEEPSDGHGLSVSLMFKTVKPKARKELSEKAVSTSTVAKQT